MSVELEGPVEVIALPAGVRDVLPTESEELAEIERCLASLFARYGYRRVRTPAIEFAAVMDRAQEGGLGAAFRLFDDHGEVLVLRPDLTIPIARLVATRLADHPGPVRVAYDASAFRPAPVGRADTAEERQAGVELVGPPGPAADAEAIGVLAQALRELGLDSVKIGVGDVSLTRAVLTGLGVSEEDRESLRRAAAERNFVAWRRRAERLALAEPARALAARLPTLRGGREVLEVLAEQVPVAEPACARLAQVLDLLAGHGVQETVLVDLGVWREWPYYSGVVFEAYTGSVGSPVAVGGRYDGLGARFGTDRPAVGFAIRLDRVHQALAAGYAAASPLREGVVLAGGLGPELEQGRVLRERGLPVAAASEDRGAAAALAEADGWRFLAWRAGEGFRLLDRGSGAEVACRSIEEGIASLP